MSVQVQGGAVFSGELEALEWDGLQLHTELAVLDVKFFLLHDDTLVKLASRRSTRDAELAVGAYLALEGQGKAALTHLAKAEDLGASDEEIAALEILADLERAKKRVKAEIRTEKRRWSKVTSALESAFGHYKKARKVPAPEYAKMLASLVKVDRSPGLTARDIAWMNDRTQEEFGHSLRAAMQKARELCDKEHRYEDRRIVLCSRCDGRGTIPASQQKGFGIKGGRNERVKCRTCKGKGERNCPDCWERANWKDALELQNRTPADPKTLTRPPSTVPR